MNPPTKDHIKARVKRSRVHHNKSLHDCNLVARSDKKKVEFGQAGWLAPLLARFSERNWFEEEVEVED